jgi:two-component system chemotaxis response regulator CheY
VLLEILKTVGSIHVAVNGTEAVQAFRSALESGAPYGMVCLDIFMPGMDGMEVLKLLRGLEAERGIASTSGARILMVTGSQQLKDVFRSYHGLCDGYLQKPLDRAKLFQELRRLALIP